MPFNNEGLWTPDETIGQAPLAGLEMGNVEQSLQNFRQAKAAKQEEALLSMLNASSKTGVDVGQSPTSQAFESTMGLAPNESSGLFHQLPEQKFLDTYQGMSDEDQQDPAKVTAAAIGSGALQSGGILKTVDENRKIGLAATSAKKVEDARVASIQNEIIRSIDKGKGMYDSPQATAQAAVDQIIATRSDLSEREIANIQNIPKGLPSSWPAESTIGAGIAGTKAGTAKKTAETTQITTLLPDKKALIESQTAVNGARQAYLNAAASKAGTSSDLAKQKLAQDWADKAQKHVDALTKAGAPQDQIAAAQTEATKAKAALKAPAKAASGAPPPGTVYLRDTALPDGPTPGHPDYYAKDGKLYGPPQGF